MSLLLDTHILLWVGESPEKLPSDIADMIENGDDDVAFSTVNIWEIAIKYALGRPDFRTDPALVLRRFREAGYRELAVTSEHAMRVGTLARLHNDPFDRLLVAQAMVEGMTLLTADAALAAYPAMVRIV
ncbi:type II toxin-antitoxin system VapC family toxin [Sphingomonas sp. SUN039]|uniref:type II toxin-antitoxin system VapC family toxin n=1 Tax=Sphingomonas sp. SUN039 TaxID=2937787 RepID=UPI0021640F1E|nr:type II toxin-antitoxin system VapC family toxin [Sphingomonas sp. SUN039]UVO54882.1 type II toxin-antitoxin system VapC family toxin [Sphingomonas sp. SUN039]